ncbi:MAG: 2-amino-4-hydroxy-6-hydroxymethyldihydropteridine diphosphokinase [Deltaproteobacteria bacterium]|nr:2-amino-4-hydroxy-6-hydroxymethyldihydropteridine diphosphokinase [Candidatus Deferrimicrobiaceae bacterium]
MGSNVGRRLRHLREGLALLAGKVEITRVSRIYAGEPWGRPDQPWFLNLAVRGTCVMPPEDLLVFVKEVEAMAGRKPRGRWGPRELDVDILLMGERVVCEPDLVIPHPRLASRRFCLVPLAEIAPSAVVPPGGRTVRELLEACRDPLEVFSI